MIRRAFEDLTGQAHRRVLIAERGLGPSDAERAPRRPRIERGSSREVFERLSRFFDEQLHFAGQRGHIDVLGVALREGFDELLGARQL